LNRTRTFHEYVILREVLLTYYFSYAGFGFLFIFNADQRVQTQWHTLPQSILHAYRHAYQLDSASAYTNPHADLILSSSRTGLRSPSSVLTRRKIREARRRRREAEGAASSKAKDNERSSDRLKVFNNNVQSQATTAQIENAAGRGGVRQPHTQLALSIRRHFNSQQVIEGDVIAKFVYVVRHSNAAATLGGGSGVVGMAGSKVLAIGPNEIDTGWEMASSGREEDRRRDLGFRLRFRP
jgi:hypothetical protein